MAFGFTFPTRTGINNARGKIPGLNLKRTATEQLSFNGKINEASFLYGDTPGGRKLADSVFNTAVSSTTGGRCVSWSPSGKYLAVGSADTPFITIYYFDGQNFIKLTNPTTLPNSAVIDMAWTPDEDYLFLVVSSSPYLYVYSIRDSLGTSTITFITFGDSTGANPLPRYNSIAMSPRGDQFILGTESAPYYLLMTINYSGYNYTTGERLLNLTGTIIPTHSGVGGNSYINLPSAPFSCAWSPDGTKIAFSLGVSPYMHVWELNDSTGWTKLANPTTLPDNKCYKISFSPNGKYLAVSHMWGWRFSIFSIEGSTITKLSTMAGEGGGPAELDPPPSTFPYSGDGHGHCWSTYGNFLVSGLDNTPYLLVNYVYEGTVKRIPFLATQPAKRARDISFSPDGQHFVLVNSSTVCVHAYKSYSGTINNSGLVEISPPSNIPRI